MAAQRGGRRRAPRPDLFRDALAAALADALDVDPSALAVSVTLDGDAVSTDRLPVTLTLDAPSADTDDASDASDEQDTTDTTAGSDTPDSDAPTSRSGRDSVPDARAEEGSSLSAEDIDEEAEAAADLLEGLLDAMDLPGDLRINVQDAHAEVEVVGLEEGVLIGRRGQTLEAVQELVRTAMQRRFERRSRVLVDVDGYRARRMEKLLERADEAVAEVLDGGEPQRLEPMDPIERRLVHQRVAETAGVVSTSHGREPARRIVIELADD